MRLYVQVSFTEISRRLTIKNSTPVCELWCVSTSLFCDQNERLGTRVKARSVHFILKKGERAGRQVLLHHPQLIWWRDLAMGRRQPGTNTGNCQGKPFLLLLPLQSNKLFIPASDPSIYFPLTWARGSPKRANCKHSVPRERWNPPLSSSVWLANNWSAEVRLIIFAKNQSVAADWSSANQSTQGCLQEMWKPLWPVKISTAHTCY